MVRNDDAAIAGNCGRGREFEFGALNGLKDFIRSQQGFGIAKYQPSHGHTQR